MTVLIAMLVAFVAGAVGGVMAAVFMEAYFQRIESNKIGEYQLIEQPTDRRAG